jgi:hypothetical protein
MHLSEAKAPDDVLEHDAVEIQQQPKLDAAKPKIGQQRASWIRMIWSTALTSMIRLFSITRSVR